MKKLYVSNATESSRMFKSNLLESLSKVHFSVPLFVFVPIIGYFLYQAFQAPDLTLLDGVALFFLGLLAWTATEYIMHRFVFHYQPSSKIGQRIHFIFHGVHHDYPKDRLRLVLPPSVSIPLASAFYFLFRWIIEGSDFYPFFGAFLLGYLIYDMFHYAIHHVNVKGRLWNVLKTHHLKHHYVDDEKGYGVSSPLWDYLVRSDFEKSLENDSKKSSS